MLIIVEGYKCFGNQYCLSRYGEYVGWSEIELKERCDGDNKCLAYDYLPDGTYSLGNICNSTKSVPSRKDFKVCKKGTISALKYPEGKRKYRI